MTRFIKTFSFAASLALAAPVIANACTHDEMVGKTRMAMAALAMHQGDAKMDAMATELHTFWSQHLNDAAPTESACLMLDKIFNGVAAANGR